ncbi:Ppx/GppA phosphatase family protein [Rhizobium rhizogenes]|uniref:Ppx/GppA phosphatase N-terminal domain-containing protein n=1 Tax=Rhizobium rhizogenes NBRC 13257 TaxID=1220581 RepID=A0AA87QAI6_RHIRH|nr:Ppx/GppA phosphatase family protein [Rhizobium rhizogenes]NTF60547.1 Ppx/GppA family phosphatase [Rhizobium rhizogenes]NTF66988.1 Ppx/GppA family phosphatase [Rhizobium rhizogenes]NTF99256.1 Ppx/GppA family phosphatase [Rhizobium rhizogenes]NTG40094.1 Ppx/GppA family phosphatase [Rhizobium rhizogenes]NTG59356.1 Ppx/GppA family phosphatase [Rhizobium rhizogenes]
MSDPDSGRAPQADGASVAERRKGKSSRRAKRKRGGQARPNALSAEANQTGKSGAVATRPADQDAGFPAKKRKRRRRSRGGAQDGAQHSSQSQQPQASAAPDQRAASEHGHASSNKSGKNRRKHRSKRGLQGRPLAHEKTAQLVAPAAVVAAERAPAHNDHRLQPQQRREGSASYQQADPDSRPMDLYAALDLGTNNCRLLIAQPTRPGQFRVVDAFSRIVRLGEGLGASGRLSGDAMDRAVEALRICAAKLKTREIRRMRLIATEACRAAENGEVFLARVIEETGLQLEIIDRETEARLAVSGCSSLVGPEARSVVLFDIGGGSSEIAIIRIGENRSSRLANHITHWTSLPVGVVTLSERHGGRDVTPELFEAMVREVEGMLERFDCPPVHGATRDSADFHLIGTSGTVTTLAGVHLDLPRYDRRRVDGVWLSDDEVTAMQAKLLSWDFAGRAANPCIGPDRADLVLAGCAILEAIRRRWPSPRMRVADRGLREGLLTDMMADDGVWRRGRSRRGHRPRDTKGPQA